MKFIDLTGKKFNRLLVIERNKTKTGQGTHWLCKCDCGKTKIINATSLKNGHTKSCGCYWDEQMKADRIDIIGKRFGKLLVIEKIDKKGHWKCKCDCGNEIITYAPSLYSGASKSCGCLRKEILSGENSIFWKGGITNENRRIKSQPKYYKWSKEIRKRDKKCQKCEKDKKLHAHHIINFSFNINVALDLNNGITLCEDCHKLFHKTYGKTKNDENQINEFLKT
jgi:hypothetical protein